jgi:hypothetical protein
MIKDNSSTSLTLEGLRVKDATERQRPRGARPEDAFFVIRLDDDSFWATGFWRGDAVVFLKGDHEFQIMDIVLARTPAGVRLAYFSIETEALVRLEGGGLDQPTEFYRPEEIEIIGRACDVWRRGWRVDLEYPFRPLYAPAHFLDDEEEVEV